MNVPNELWREYMRYPDFDEGCAMLYIVLLDCASKAPTESELAEILGASRTTIIKRRKVLEKYGLVEVLPRDKGHQRLGYRVNPIINVMDLI
ncbi:MAG: hypothetical protein LKI80_16650 [Sporolactobacillus sp.]|jgi:predicted transcriptional regulator|nr:hypothetical protein [Sporolactobacillus sp.]